MRTLVLTVALALSFALPAGAQTLTPLERQMLEMAGNFGTMHHLTQICEGEQHQEWRDSMLELIRLEDPSREQRQRMGERFNDAYHEVAERFPRCDGAARAYAGQLAREGAALAEQMASALR